MICEADDGNTLSQLKTLDLRVSATCDGCGHMVQLNLDGLIDRFGGDKPIRRVALGLRCTQCQSRNGRVILTHAATGPRA